MVCDGHLVYHDIWHGKMNLSEEISDNSTKLLVMVKQLLDSGVY